MTPSIFPPFLSGYLRKTKNLKREHLVYSPITQRMGPGGLEFATDGYGFHIMVWGGRTLSERDMLFEEFLTMARNENIEFCENNCFVLKNLNEGGDKPTEKTIPLEDELDEVPPKPFCGIKEIWSIQSPYFKQLLFSPENKEEKEKENEKKSEEKEENRIKTVRIDGISASAMQNLERIFMGTKPSMDSPEEYTGFSLLWFCN